MTTPDDISDALVALITAGAPGALVLDHDALPVKADEIPAEGVYGVFLFEDAPEDGEGITDSAGTHTRIASFKIEGRIGKSPHLLHGTRALRALLASIVKADPFLGRLAIDTRLGPMRVLVHETNSAVGAFTQDVNVHYQFQPE